MLRKTISLLCLAALLVLLPAMPARAETAREITSKCKIRVSDGKKALLTDHNIRSYWGPWGVGSKLGVTLPEGETAGTLVIEWFSGPSPYTLGEYDADKNLIAEHTEQEVEYRLVNVYPLNSATKHILFTFKSETQKISGLYVYSAGTLPASVQDWDPPMDKADMMVVSTHQDDELIFLGGTIPYYSVARDKNVIVVYMANCGRYRRDEALRGLWAMGVRDYPVFLNLGDKKVATFEEGLEFWGGREHVLELLVEQIRRYRPEVIVTQDLNGEYGHIQHRLTAHSLKYAIESAADPQQFPESAAKYGAWQVKKLYNHLYKKNQITMDWSTPLPELGGKSPLEMAQIGYAEHVSQHGAYEVVAGGRYDNSHFGLSYTTVGVDTIGGDMFENIPENTDEVPVPVAADVPAEDGSEDAEEAAINAPDALGAPDTAAATVSAEAAGRSGSRNGALVLGIAAGVVALAAAAFVLVRLLPSRSGRGQSSTPRKR